MKNFKHGMQQSILYGLHLWVSKLYKYIKLKLFNFPQLILVKTYCNTIIITHWTLYTLSFLYLYCKYKILQNWKRFCCAFFYLLRWFAKMFIILYFTGISKIEIQPHTILKVHKYQFNCLQKYYAADFKY